VIFLPFLKIALKRLRPFIRINDLCFNYADAFRQTLSASFFLFADDVPGLFYHADLTCVHESRACCDAFDLKVDMFVS